MKVINLFAGPGAGKSTTAAGLFFHMKVAGYKVELVREYAKELYYQNRLYFVDQWRISEEQSSRLNDLRGHVDWVITDSPLMLGPVHANRSGIHGDTAIAYEQAVVKVFKTYDNVNVFVNRVKPYQSWGRRNSEASSRSLDGTIQALLAKHAIKYVGIDGDERAPQRVLNHLKGTHHIAA